MMMKWTWVLATLCLCGFVWRVQAAYTFYHWCGHTTHWYRAIAPNHGCYWVMLTADPKSGTSVELGMSDRPFMIARADYIVGSIGFSYCTTHNHDIKANWDSMKCTGNFESATALSVAYISSERDGESQTLMETFPGSRDPSHCSKWVAPGRRINFDSYMNEAGEWQKAWPYFYGIRVNKTGIWWVSARPDGCYKDGDDCFIYHIKNAGRLLFRLFSRKGRAVSTSGAFNLMAGSQITLRPQTPWTPFEPQTILAAIFLAYNKKPNTGTYTHIARTSLVSRTGSYWSNNDLGYLEFDTHPETDYGNMYRPDVRYSSVPVSGSYLISLRMSSLDKDCKGSFHSLKGVMYINTHKTWTSYADDGTPSGQSVALSLKKYDKIIVFPFDGSVGSETMMSIAFIAP